jgi:hypothetical protein
MTSASRALRFIASATFVGLIASATCLAEQPTEQPAQPAAQQIQPASSSHPTLDLHAYLNTPLNSAEASSSSSSMAEAASSDEAAATERLSHLSLASDKQPPPRRTYGQPHYSDSTHNADGSNKWGFLVGAGFNLPVGGSHGDITTGFDFQGAGGRFFSKKFGVVAEFDWHHFGIDTGTLNRLLVIYNSTCGVTSCGLTALGGTSHMWDFTIDPIYNFYQSEKFGSYIRGGVGFYHKTANFTIPSIGVYCDPYYGCFQYAANQTIDKYTSNAFGVEGGVGFTYRPSRFAGESFYAEGRYVFSDNSPRPFSRGSSTSNYFNVFPQNSDRTTIIPITFGLRF